MASKIGKNFRFFKFPAKIIFPAKICCSQNDLPIGTCHCFKFEKNISIIVGDIADYISHVKFPIRIKSPITPIIMVLGEKNFGSKVVHETLWISSKSVTWSRTSLVDPKNNDPYILLYNYIIKTSTGCILSGLPM